MRIFDSILIGSLLFTSSACSKTTDTEGATNADHSDHSDAGAAADDKPGDAPSATPSTATPPTPGAAPKAAAVATKFPSKAELQSLVDQLKAFEGQAKAGTLKPDELQAFMIESKAMFPPGVQPPRELIENDVKFKVDREELNALMATVPPQDLRNPAKQQEIQAKMAPLTLKLMRRTFEVLIETGWQPPAPGTAPPPPAAPPAQAGAPEPAK